MEAAIGVDIGGTSLKFAVVGRDGQVIRYATSPTAERPSSEGIMQGVLAGIQRLMDEVRDLTPWVRMSGIGIGSAGQIRTVDGSVAFAVDTIPGWTGTPIKRIVQEKFPELPVYVDNDVNVLALAEKHYGAGHKFQDFLCIALGTGLGGAIVRGGELIHGAYGGAGELGHMSVDFNGPRCSCGNFGCIELYASGTGLQRLLNERYTDGVPAPGWELNPAGLLGAWQEGDPAAAAVMDVAIRALGSALGGMIHALNPEAVILGGGLIERVPALLPAIEEATAARTSPVMWKHVRLLPALSGNQSGTIGAAAQVWQYAKQ